MDGLSAPRRFFVPRRFRGLRRLSTLRVSSAPRGFPAPCRFFAPPRSLRFALVLPLAVSFLSPALAAEGAAPTARRDDASEETGTLIRRNDALDRLAELADGEGFYLVLEPDSSRLSLMLQGALLREYRLESLTVSRPRVAFLRRSARAADVRHWRDRIWRAGELDPPRRRDRIEITAVPPDPDRPEGSVEIPIPPTPEEDILVPDRYFVRFAGGLALEVRSTPPPRGTEWVAAWEDHLAALGLRGPAEPLRLALRLSPVDADVFYRALPPAVDFVILPHGVRAVRPE